MFPPNVTQEEACQRAEVSARTDAIRQVAGETLSAEETMRCSEQGDEAECTRNSTIWTFVGGFIRDTRNYKSETVVETGAIRRCEVSFEADVFVARGKPDPNFDVGVALNNPIFRDGENLVVTLNPSLPMFVQIFQWLPYEKGDAQVGRIYPNVFDQATRIERKTTVPSMAGAKRYDLKVSFPTRQPNRLKDVDEYLMVVATKTPREFLDAYSLNDFSRVLSEIPPEESRLARRMYRVMRGSE